MRRAFTPRPYQNIGMAHLANVERCALWAGMGMGKTVTTLTFLDHLHNLAGEDRPTLVLAPLRVAKTTWPEEVKKWDHLSALEVVSVTGDAKEREAALKRDVPVYAMNYDNLVWLREWFKKNHKPWPFATIVADESTRLKGFRLRQGTVRAQALAEIAHTETKRWINLTGTPSPNGLKDLWGQTWFLDAGVRLGRTYDAFESRWFAYKKIKDALTNKPGIEPVIMPHAQEQIQERLADICLTIDPADWFDLQKPIVNTILVDMPASARSKYRDMEREMFIELGNGIEVEAFAAAGKSLKCLQLASGAVYLDPERYGEGKWIEVHFEKLEALESIINEAAGAPVLVAYHFKSDLARLQRAFPKGRVLDADPDTIRHWNAGEIPLLFAHPASAGHGLNLQDGGNIIVFFSQWWDLEQHDQIIERIGPVRQLQAGHNRPVFIHYIVARDTVDELVMARRETKREVQDLLLDYMKGKTK